MDESSFRRRSHRESNGFQPGYVPVDDEYLQHSGIRGKRSCCLCALLVVLLLVAVINALVRDNSFFQVNVNGYTLGWWGQATLSVLFLLPFAVGVNS